MKRHKFSDKVRQFSCTTFKALSVGAKFRFASEVEYPGLKTGLCEKISPRKYRYVQENMECTVGCVHVVVLNVNDQGEIIRVGHHTPYLGD